MPKATNMVPTVVLYSSNGCPHCEAAKRYLQAQGIGFRDMNLSNSPRARKELARLGARGVPVLLVGDQRMDGFDPKRFMRLYRHWRN